MGRTKVMRNWGGYPKYICAENNAKNIHDLATILNHKDSVIARGNGRSYGDASLAKNVLSIRSLEKIIHVNVQKGTATCQGGCLLGQILERIVPLGLFLPVVPGTKDITVGGAIAADIHGKNHVVAGSFCNHIESMEVMDHNGIIRSCSRSQNEQLFTMTCGGMGLTGIIIEATIKLLEIESAFIEQDVQNISSILHCEMRFDSKSSYSHQIAWIADLTAESSSQFGLFIQHRHAKIEDLSSRQQRDPLQLKKSFSLAVPFPLPIPLVNRISYSMLNWYYLKKHPINKKTYLHYLTGFFQLDTLKSWNYLYGTKGFMQYQAAIPVNRAFSAFNAYAKIMKNKRRRSFLTVIKRFGTIPAAGKLSFPIPGFTICMDFKMDQLIPAMIKEFDQITIAAGGRVYLAKDALLNPKNFMAMYPAYEELKAFIYQKHPYFRSFLSDRIGLTEL